MRGSKGGSPWGHEDRQAEAPAHEEESELPDLIMEIEDDVLREEEYNEQRATHSSNHIIKFPDYTTVVGLISKNDESTYREEVQRLTDWCRANNLSLNVNKTKEMVVDFRRTRSDQSLLNVDGSSVEIIQSIKFHLV